VTDHAWAGDPMIHTPIRVTVIGGYLGAGKTTLVNHVLRSADERIAVIVNDFGDVNIDAELIESTDGGTISLTNGCICCSVVDGFTVALDTIRASSPRPERLVIEASGVAIPAHVAAYAYGPGLDLDGVITVVDAETIRRNARSEYVGDVIAHQNTATDLIVLNKVDLVDDDAIASLTAWLAEVTDAPVIPARDGRVDLSVLLGLDATDRTAVSTTPTDTSFTSRTERWHEPIDRTSFEQQIAAFPDAVVRAKGVVRFTDDPSTEAMVQVVGRRVSITAGGPWMREDSQLVIISLVEDEHTADVKADKADRPEDQVAGSTGSASVGSTGSIG
jgi:G3E family GTPase